MINNIPRENYQGKHILTKNFSLDTDSFKTGLNNNVLIIGASGAGKTRHYVKPNILNSHESMIISDTKGALCKSLGPLLVEKGYEVQEINFNDLSSGTGYNPLDFIRYNEETDTYSEQDILSLCECIIPISCQKDPYWDHAARQYLSCVISYVMEALPEEEHTFEYVVKAFHNLGSSEFNRQVDEISILKPHSTLATRYQALNTIRIADRMDASIKGILSTNLDPLYFDKALELYKKSEKIDFTALAKKKVAIFLTVSDTDRSLDKLANAFMTQAIRSLSRYADTECEHNMLPIPVRFYLDDFATNLYIPDFDKIISVIRSREIYVSVILQSISQLDTLYDKSGAMTIINNCDSQLYLGGQDVDTAEYFSVKANKPSSAILSMPLNHAYLFVRGREPVQTETYIQYQEFDIQ